MKFNLLLKKSLIAGLTFIVCCPTMAGISSVIRDSNQQVLFLSKPEAVALCESRGGKLPSNRQFAEFAIALGAAGIKETKYRDQGNTPAAMMERANYRKQGYFILYMIDRFRQNVVDFYFKNVGFENPDFNNPEDQIFTWTENVYPQDQKFSYIFSEYDGAIVAPGGNIETEQYAVRCWIP